MASKPWDYIAKVVNIGDSGCGKSCVLPPLLLLIPPTASNPPQLTIRLCEGRFNPNHYLTIGCEIGSRIIPVTDTKKIKLQVWDTAGQEHFRAVTRSYFRGATGALLVFDLTRRETFEHAIEWLGELRAAADSNISIILVGNKADLCEGDAGGKRAVTEEEARDWAEKNGVKSYVECSAKTGEKVEEAFVECAKEIYGNIMSGVYDLNDRSHGIKRNVGKGGLGIDEMTKGGAGCSC